MIDKEYLDTLFEYKEGLLFWKVARSNRIQIGSLVGSDTGNGYLKVSIDKKYYKVHRLIYIIHYGDLDDDIDVDHIDGNGFNNKIENLRLVTKSENQQNRIKRTILTSKYKGVNFDKNRNKWKAEIRVDNVSYHIGRFDTEEDARDAYRMIAKEIHGEFFNDGEIDDNKR